MKGRERNNKKVLRMLLKRNPILLLLFSNKKSLRFWSFNI